jgi:hypothetical protein
VVKSIVAIDGPPVRFRVGATWLRPYPGENTASRPISHSQAPESPVSIVVGDHTRILGAVIFFPGCEAVDLDFWWLYLYLVVCDGALLRVLLPDLVDVFLIHTNVDMLGLHVCRSLNPQTMLKYPTSTNKTFSHISCDSWARTNVASSIAFSLVEGSRTRAMTYHSSIIIQ